MSRGPEPSRGGACPISTGRTRIPRPWRYMTRRRARVRAPAAAALLVAVSLGSVCHFWHHLADPDCGAVGRHGAQPCATCSALHSAAVAAKPQAPAPPIHSVLAVLPLSLAENPARPVVLGGAPRAPPV